MTANRTPAAKSAPARSAAAPESMVDENLRRGRGARSNHSGRFETERRTSFDDGWEGLADLEALRTEIFIEPARSIITRNQSPDISFDQSINPYRGCEHGCVYCYARPSHCYLGHSAGLDFETKLYAKTNAAELLEKELASKSYTPKVIALGTNTDPYQPIEREQRITRQILEVLERTGHPVGIVTKSSLVLRDVDILSRMAARGLAKVAISVTSLDRRIARAMEPRAVTPAKRIEAIRGLSEAGVPVAVMVAPIVPGLTDSEIERILEAARGAGAEEAGYVLLRLPLEIKDIFREWLASEFPDRADRVINLLRSMHGGQDYVAEFGRRQKGNGPYAEQIALRFRLALKRLGLNERRHALRLDLFTRPVGKGQQMPLL
ncbi:PA0069 family radical SAM protein [Hyphomicrobium sp. LHD-15]|uniref:PA0069 family radical SAM protein n=1 Tax=Hyphomicrobium sp. LHD-15 TaxID=3072142 RepID=UPI0035BE2CFD